MPSLQPRALSVIYSTAKRAWLVFCQVAGRPSLNASGKGESLTCLHVLYIIVRGRTSQSHSGSSALDIPGVLLQGTIWRGGHLLPARGGLSRSAASGSLASQQPSQITCAPKLPYLQCICYTVTASEGPAQSLQNDCKLNVPVQDAQLRWHLAPWSSHCSWRAPSLPSPGPCQVS